MMRPEMWPDYNRAPMTTNDWSLTSHWGWYVFAAAVVSVVVRAILAGWQESRQAFDRFLVGNLLVILFSYLWLAQFVQPRLTP